MKVLPWVFPPLPPSWETVSLIQRMVSCLDLLRSHRSRSGGVLTMMVESERMNGINLSIDRISSLLSNSSDWRVRSKFNQLRYCPSIGETSKYGLKYLGSETCHVTQAPTYTGSLYITNAISVKGIFRIRGQISRHWSAVSEKNFIARFFLMQIPTNLFQNRAKSGSQSTEYKE